MEYIINGAVVIVEEVTHVNLKTAKSFDKKAKAGDMMVTEPNRNVTLMEREAFDALNPVKVE